MLELLCRSELLVGRGLEVNSLKIGTLSLSACVDRRKAIGRWRWRRCVLVVFHGVVERVRRGCEDSSKSGARRGDPVLRVKLQESRLREISGSNTEIEIAFECAFG